MSMRKASERQNSFALKNSIKNISDFIRLQSGLKLEIAPKAREKYRVKTLDASSQKLENIVCECWIATRFQKKSACGRQKNRRNQVSDIVEIPASVTHMRARTLTGVSFGNDLTNLKATLHVEG